MVQKPRRSDEEGEYYWPWNFPWIETAIGGIEYLVLTPAQIKAQEKYEKEHRDDEFGFR